MHATSSSFDLVPDTLPIVRQLRHVPAAAEWLRRLPSTIGEVRREFQLTLFAPLPAGSCSWVAPAVLSDGTQAIVKIGFPHREMLGEAAALRIWDGDGAARLLAHDPARHALLLERCLPGTPLDAFTCTPADERLQSACSVLLQLWAAPFPAGSLIESLATVAADWAVLTEERMQRIRPGYDRGLVRDGITLMRELPLASANDVLLHGDFHPGNILSTLDNRWKAIDPKPMHGDPAFDPWPLLEQVDDPFKYEDCSRVLRTRIRLLADSLAIDDDRIALWAVARRVETALRVADYGHLSGGSAIMGEARTLLAL